LGYERGDEPCYYAGDIHIDIGKWFDECEPNGDYDLHTHCDQCLRPNHIYGNGYHKHAEQANHQLVHGESDEHRFGCQQFAELGYKRGDEPCYYAGDIHIYIGKWFDECESNGNDDLYTHCDQCLRPDYIYGKGHCDSVKWRTDDHNNYVLRRDTRHRVRGLHCRRQWWLSALHLFR
jgi:hypothetical protein